MVEDDFRVNSQYARNEENPSEVDVMMVDDHAREKPNSDHGENEMADIDNHMKDESPEAKQPKKMSCEIRVDQRR